MGQRIKVVLIQLNDKLVYAGYKHTGTKRTPLGLAYVASSMIKEGYDVEIVDGALDNLEIDEIVSRVLEKNPKIVGITCTTPLFPQLVEIVKGIKKYDIKIFIGGPHVSALPEISLATSGADWVSVGDYEKVKHLDEIPYPARHLLRTNEYVDYARGVLTPQTSIITSRGCVGRCGFCNAAGTKVRFRSVSNVIGELEEIYHTYGIRNLVFYDDSFTTVKKRIMEICGGMIERGLDFKYQVQLRLDQVDDEIMDILVKSGCDQVGPGIESGNQIILKDICKSPKADIDFVLRKCELIKKYPVKLRCSYIMGWIDETEEQIWDTIKLAKQIDSHENAFSIATPYPGTRMWRVALERGQVSENMDFSNFLYYHKVGCNLSKVSNDRLMELHELAYKEVGNREYILK